MRHHTPIRVALLMPMRQAYGRSVALGVYRIAREIGWHVFHIESTVTVIGALRAMRISAVIAQIVNPRVHEELRRHGVPVVNVSSVLPATFKRFPRVIHDDQAIGRLAVEHLRDHGARQIQFVRAATEGPPPTYANDRALGARDACLRLGLPWLDEILLPDQLHPYGHDRGMARRYRALARQLQRLPHRAGLFAVTDTQGVAILDLCRDAGIPVPSQLLVLGVNDDHLLCEMPQPTLSSVHTQPELIGQEAALLLRSKLDGGSMPDAPLRVPPLGVTSRQSTDLVSACDERVRAATRHILAHYQQRLRVADVAIATGTNRRTLEKEFRAQLGRTVHDEIMRVRLDESCRLLTDTNLPVAAIGDRCGFSNPHLFSATFRHRMTLSPRAYRDSARTLRRADP